MLATPSDKKPSRDSVECSSSSFSRTSRLRVMMSAPEVKDGRLSGNDYWKTVAALKRYRDKKDRPDQLPDALVGLNLSTEKKINAAICNYSMLAFQMYKKACGEAGKSSQTAKERLSLYHSMACCLYQAKQYTKARLYALVGLRLAINSFLSKMEDITEYFKLISLFSKLIQMADTKLNDTDKPSSSPCKKAKATPRISDTNDVLAKLAKQDERSFPVLTAVDLEKVTEFINAELRNHVRDLILKCSTITRQQTYFVKKHAVWQYTKAVAMVLLGIAVAAFAMWLLLIAVSSLSGVTVGLMITMIFGAIVGLYLAYKCLKKAAALLGEVKTRRDINASLREAFSQDSFHRFLTFLNGEISPGEDNTPHNFNIKVKHIVNTLSSHGMAASSIVNLLNRIIESYVFKEGIGSCNLHYSLAIRALQQIKEEYEEAAGPLPKALSEMLLITSINNVFLSLSIHPQFSIEEDVETISQHLSTLDNQVGNSVHQRLEALREFLNILGVHHQLPKSSPRSRSDTIRLSSGVGFFKGGALTDTVAEKTVPSKLSFLSS